MEMVLPQWSKPPFRASRFDTQDIAAAIGPVADGEWKVLTLTGELDSGSEFAIQDCVIIRKKK